MTLSNALHSAMSGLVAAGRASGVVSANIANAMNPGYARRSLTLAANARSGPGVLVVGVERHADPVLIANRRAADAASASATALTDFHARVETLVGRAGDPASLGLRLADFESSLVVAASRPESAQHLDTMAARARDLAAAISGAAEGIATMRSRADRTGPSPGTRPDCNALMASPWASSGSSRCSAQRPSFSRRLMRATRETGGARPGPAAAVPTRSHRSS